MEIKGKTAAMLLGSAFGMSSKEIEEVIGEDGVKEATEEIIEKDLLGKSIIGGSNEN